MANNTLYESDSGEEVVSPYNDVGDSDNDEDSLIDVDSPADGYFAHRDHPQQTFVENPAVRPAEDKAREAAQDRPSGLRGGGGQTVEDATPPTAQMWTGEATPLLDVGPAPPDYATATAGRRIPPAQSPGQADVNLRGGAGYGSIQNLPSDHPLVRNGLFGERGSLSASGQPQSMRDETAQQRTQPSDSVTNEASLRNTRGDRSAGSESADQQQSSQDSKRHGRWRCGCCKPMTWLNWVLGFGVILAIILISRTNIKTDGRGSGHSDPGTPIDRPGKGSDIPVPDHPTSRQCPFDSYSETLSFEFSAPGNFSFVELIDSSDYTRLMPGGVNLSGTLKITPAPSDQNDDIRVSVRIATTNPWSISQLRYVKDGDGVELRFPKIAQRHQKGSERFENACLDIAALVQVRDRVTVQDWKISTANMDIIVDTGLFTSKSANDNSVSTELDAAQGGLFVRNETSIWALKGDVAAAYWSSRHTHVSTISGKIKGTYALRDSLVLDSISGAIDVGVEPKRADRYHPVAPELSVKSNSGRINVEFPSRHSPSESPIPEREYKSRVESYSSKISGRYILGASSIFKTFSGDMKIDVVPYPDNLFNYSLYTSTLSGKTRLEMLECITRVSFPTSARSVSPHSEHSSQWIMGSIHSVHKSTSGAIDLVYPQPWTGMIDGRSISGSIHVGGEGVKIIKDVNGPANRRVVATKGKGDSNLVFKTISGSVDVLVGDLD